MKNIQSSNTFIDPTAQGFNREFPIDVSSECNLSNTMVRNVALAGVQSLIFRTDSLFNIINNLDQKMIVKRILFKTKQSLMKNIQNLKKRILN